MRHSLPRAVPLLGRVGGILRAWLRRAEVDRAVFSWQLLAEPITLLLIARFFTPELQGFYYTFASLLALQSFVELGLYLVIVNVASHEWAHLHLDETGRIDGDPEARSRLVSLGRLIFVWYAVASIIFVIGVSAVGAIFFARNLHDGIAWQGPWLAVVGLSGVLLWALPFNSLLEGCGQIATINRFRLQQLVLSSLALWGTLALGGGLWALAIAVGAKVLRDLYLLLVRYRRFFAPFLVRPTGATIHWRAEIWPMQWRLALSGAVNYFAFSLFTPVMFRYHGATVAGQMGMTLAAITGLQAIALAWVQTKVPQFGVLVARRDYATLDRFFYRTSLVSLLAILLGAASTWGVLLTLGLIGHPLAGRLLSPLPAGFFLLAVVVMQVSQCQTAYLRAHKREPIVVLSVVMSLAIGLAVWLLGSRYGATGAGAGYLAMALIIVGWETRIWLRCRAEWHRA
jgi:hypothetical protein